MTSFNFNDICHRVFEHPCVLYFESLTTSGCTFLIKMVIYLSGHISYKGMVTNGKVLQSVEMTIVYRYLN